MKKILALSLVAATALVSNAATVSISSIIDGGAYSTDITGVGSGDYNDSTFAFNIAGSLGSFGDGTTGQIPSGIVGYVEGPAGFSKSLTVTSSDTFAAAFNLNDTAPSGFPTGYYLSFYNSSSVLIAKGSIVVGTVTTPEPQTYAMVAGAALLGFAAFRRARR